MLKDVWAPLDLHDTKDGVRGIIKLVGNTWRARWKYHEFTEMSWIKALWIQVTGVLLIKNLTESYACEKYIFAKKQTP